MIEIPKDDCTVYENTLSSHYFICMDSILQACPLMRSVQFNYFSTKLQDLTL